MDNEPFNTNPNEPQQLNPDSTPPPHLIDLRRELTKALDTLEAAHRHLTHHATANAALHLSDNVIPSPLATKVQTTINSIHAALRRTQDPRDFALFIKGIKTDSGLKWETLASIFGVSRNTIYQWTTHGTANAAHKQLGTANAAHKQLGTELAALLATMPGPPEERRKRLYAPRPEDDNRSWIDHFKAHWATNHDVLTNPNDQYHQ